MAAETVSVKERDYLEQDTAIRGQQYVCLSFISPEDVIKNKETYMFSKFLASFSKDLNEFFDSLGDKFKDDKDTQDMLHLVKDRYDFMFKPDSMDAEYKFFKQNKGEQLESEYFEQNNFQTSIRGIKVRGSYESIPEAKNRAEQIKKFDKIFDVYIAEVGCWCPWSPNADDIKNQEYTETQLNTLMKKYKENQEVKDEMYMQRQHELMQKAKDHSTRQQPVEETLTEVDPWLAKKQEEAEEKQEVVVEEEKQEEAEEKQEVVVEEEKQE